MSKRLITIDGIPVLIIRTPIPVQTRVHRMPFLRAPCKHRKYIQAQIEGFTIGTLFVSVREAVKAVQVYV
jgi:hypothetical protein